MSFVETMTKLWQTSGFANLTIQGLIMIIISLVLIYLAVVKQFEPLLLLPIAFGMLLANLPISGLFHPDLFKGTIDFGNVLHNGGLVDILYLGVKLGIYPSLIFMGIGAMTDFGPLIARPSSLLLGGAAQLGIYTALILASLLGFCDQAAASIAIIGGADGPTAIYLTTKLYPEILPAVAIAAYSYMALIPIIQPPIMNLLTTKKEREVVMKEPRTVSKSEKIIFPIAITIITVFLLPSVAPLIGMFMLGNLFKETGVVDRLSDTSQNALMNIVTIFLGVSVGATAVGKNFLAPETLKVIFLGLFAFCFSTVGGVLFGKIMCAVTK